MIDEIVDKLLAGDLGDELAPSEVGEFTMLLCQTFYKRHGIECSFRRLDGCDIVCAVDFDPCKFMVVVEDRIYYVVDPTGLIAPDVASMRFIMNDLPGEFLASVSEGGGFVKSVYTLPDGTEIMAIDNRLDGPDREVRFYRNGVLDEEATGRWSRDYLGSLGGS